MPYYHDASPYDCNFLISFIIIGNFELSVFHCIQGLVKAIQYDLINWESFNQKEYERFERVENGDMNWIIEGQLLAFSGPHNTVEIIDGVRTLQPEDYLPLFQHLHIGVVIRLNRATYDASRFTNHGIQHYDIFFPDGGLPQCTPILFL